jgi:transcriptional regulator with XRE-family HTH domain
MLLWCSCLASATVPGMTKPDKVVGARLTRLREERGLSQEALAFKSGLSTSTISRTERAKHYPSLPTMRKLAAGLDISLESLMAD